MHWSKECHRFRLVFKVFYKVKVHFTGSKQRFTLNLYSFLILFLAECKLDVLVGFDVAAQNIFAAQKTLETKVATILQRITQMQLISCSSGQVPSIQVGMLAMDSASEPVLLDFTNRYTELIEPFKALRNRGPFVLNGATIKAYADRFKSQPSDHVKVHPFHSGLI